MAQAWELDDGEEAQAWYWMMVKKSNDGSLGLVIECLGLVFDWGKQVK